MKKFLIILSMFFCMPVFADTMPFYTNSIPKNSIGTYQIDKDLIIFSHPEANSNIIKNLIFFHLLIPQTFYQAFLGHHKKIQTFL